MIENRFLMHLFQNCVRDIPISNRFSIHMSYFNNIIVIDLKNKIQYQIMKADSFKKSMQKLNTAARQQSTSFKTKVLDSSNPIKSHSKDRSKVIPSKNLMEEFNAADRKLIRKSESSTKKISHKKSIHQENPTPMKIIEDRQSKKKVKKFIDAEMDTQSHGTDNNLDTNKSYGSGKSSNIVLLNPSMKKRRKSVQFADQIDQQQIQTPSVASSVQRRPASIKNHYTFNQKQNIENYNTDLPKSYILALQGLQEAIKSRDKEIKSLKESLKINEETIFAQQNKLDQITEKYQFCLEIQKEKDIQIRYLKNQIHQLRISKEQLIKGAANSLIFETKKRQYEKQLENVKLLQQIQIEKAIIQGQKRKIIEQQENRRKMIQQQEKRIKELQKVRKDAIQMQKLKQRQLEALKERQRLNLIEEEIVENEKMNRKIMQRQPSQSERMLRQRSKTVKSTIKKPSTFTNQIEIGSIRKQNYMQVGQSSMVSMISKKQSELRSNYENAHSCKELVSKMREIMRHQKELISLNYQMEQIEAKLALHKGNPPNNDQTSKTYMKLKRQIEKKEAIIKELKLIQN